MLKTLFELGTSRTSRLLPMEGLRGFAVILVFLVHYNALFAFLLQNSPAQARISARFASIGHSGVDLFFVLSGYLIYSAALRPNLNFVSFMRRRAIRIYPVFLVVLSVYLVLALFPGPAAAKLPRDGKFLYILQNIALLPGVFNIKPIITVAWSLSYEWYFYLVAPALAIGLQLSDWSSHRRVILIASLSLAYLAVCLLPGRNHPQFLMFAAGMLLFELIRYGRPEWILSAAGERVVILAVPAGLWLSGVLADVTLSYPRAWSLRVLTLCLVLFPLVLYCFKYEGLLKQVFSFAPLRYWGNMSYSYYLCHGMVMNGIARLLHALQPSEALFWLLLPLVCLLSIIGSAIVYLLVERPLSLSPNQPARVETHQVPMESREFSSSIAAK